MGILVGTALGMHPLDPQRLEALSPLMRNKLAGDARREADCKAKNKQVASQGTASSKEVRLKQLPKSHNKQ